MFPISFQLPSTIMRWLWRHICFDWCCLDMATYCTHGGNALSDCFSQTYGPVSLQVANACCRSSAWNLNVFFCSILGCYASCHKPQQNHWQDSQHTCKPIFAVSLQVAALERQDLSCTYLAHHQSECVWTNIIIIIIPLPLPLSLPPLISLLF